MYLPVESIMIPVAVLRELFTDTLGVLILIPRANVSLPSARLSKNTGTVTELVVLPAGNVAVSAAELKSLSATQYCNINFVCEVFMLPVADTGTDCIGSTLILIGRLGTPPVKSRLTCIRPEISVPTNEGAEKPTDSPVIQQYK